MQVETYRTLFPLFEELRGARVMLRPYQESDALALFEAVAESREHLRSWQPWIANSHQTVEESRDVVIHWMAQWLLRENLIVGIWDQLNGYYLGSCGLHPKNWECGYFEIRYWLRASAIRRGYMTEAVGLLCDYAFTALKAHRVEIRCEESNERSTAVAQRLGFVQEGRLRSIPLGRTGHLCTLLIFSLVAGER